MVAQCDALITFIQQRKVELIDAITTEMNSKIQKVKEQVKACDKKFQSVAGLLQYANECLQGTDAASFLLVRTKLPLKHNAMLISSNREIHRICIGNTKLYEKRKKLLLVMLVQ